LALISVCASRSIEVPMANVQCEICTDLADAIEKYVAENKTEDQILKLLQGVCSGMGPLKTPCDTIVTAYGPQMIQLLEAKESPEVVCKQVGLCKNSTSVEAVSPVQCQICTDLADAIEKYIAENKTEAQIMKLLEGVCSGLGALKAPCDTIVTQYGPEMIQLLEAKESPEVVCKQVGLCKNATSVHVEFVKTLRASPVQCEICTELADAIEKYIAQNKTEAQILKLLDGVCSSMGALKTPCEGVVTAYGPTMIQLLEAKETPDAVCKQVGLCKNMTAFQLPKATVQCQICEELADAAEKYIAENKTEAEILKLLEGICNGLNAMKAPCTTIVVSYGPQMIALLEAKESPETVCKQLGMCKNSTVIVPVRSEAFGRARAVQHLIQLLN